MRIKTLQMSWFRGAGNLVSLEPDCKSMVIYGENGSGKSSFVDAVEYILNNGRINHLAHEYSGKRQERAIHNTHKPQGEKTRLIVTFKDGSVQETEIKQNGSATYSGAEAIAMQSWNYRRTVLRQDEVATFIHDTKGDKYSTLLPLLGLGQMDVVAENIRQTVKAIEQNSRLKEIKGSIKEINKKREEILGTASDDQVLGKIREIHTRYCLPISETTNAISFCNELADAIGTRTAKLSSENSAHFVLQTIRQLDLKSQISAVRSACLKLADMAEPLIVEEFNVLQSAVIYADKLEADGGDVKCPACGHFIPINNFQAHVKSEKERLQDIIFVLNARKTAIESLCDTIKSLKNNTNKHEVKLWREKISKGGLSDNLSFLEGINIDQFRVTCGEEGLIVLEEKLQPIIDDATEASKDAPPDVQQLLVDKQIVDISKAIFESKEQVNEINRIETLLLYLNSLEQRIRDGIRENAQTEIDKISGDIQSMWKILHPCTAIEEVRLYFPEDEDKGIDIGMKFYGVEQPSPRLTLSEGYRNSLGLCIFLSMAKSEEKQDRPLFLDDVIVSMDRNHRGMVAELLAEEFRGRQVVILTHDREWYTELRHQLDGKDWIFRTLLPYETPDIGIRWSHKTTTFGDARVQLKERPDSAGNDARKIMDVELALIAERLQVNMPYVRGDKNDKRMAHDFLETLIASAKKCFQKKVDGNFVIHTDAIEMFEKADRLIISWANRASHTFDVVNPEATKLIDTCEKALEFFKCSSCLKHVWFADAEGSEWVQCQCGEIRWRYGKNKE